MGKRAMVGAWARHVSGLGAVLAVVAAQRPASADVSPADQAAAQVLFREALQLLSASTQLDVACAKLAESQRLDPAPGTLLNLGECEERRGRLASAYGAFLAAKVQAEREGDRKGRIIEAERRAKLLEPLLPMLAIAVAPASMAPGLSVKRDGHEVGKELWGTGIPVDPGEHRVEASAPGREAWSAAVQVEGRPGTIAVNVPPLALAPVPADASSTGGVEPRGAGWSAQRTAGVFVGGVGAAGIVVGSVFGAITLRKTSDSSRYCEPGTPTRCSPEGIGLRNEAKATAKVSDAAFALGAAALIGGVILFVAAPSGEPRKASALRLEVGPAVGATRAGMVLHGAW
jgi:hypothetical protein